MHPLGPIGILLATIDPEALACIEVMVMPPAKPLDEAIAAAPAINRRPEGKNMRVPSAFEKEAERLRLAKYFTEKGTQ